MPEDKFDVKKAYEELKKKYSLPEFNIINQDFEIEFIDKEPFLIRSVRRKMNEKVIFFCRIIENLIYPQQPNIITMKESKILTQEDKDFLEKLYNQLMLFERESLLLDTLSSDDKDEAEMIKKMFKEWPKLKKSLEPTIIKCKQAWLKEEEKDKTHYFG